MYDTMEVEADSLKEAINLAIDVLPLPDGEFIDGSFTVEMDTLNEIYPEEIREEKINELLNYEPISES
jgi:hypothetical protein